MKVIILISLIISAFIAVESDDPAPTTYIAVSAAQCALGLPLYSSWSLSTKGQCKTCAKTLQTFMSAASQKYRASGLDCVASFYNKAANYSFSGIDTIFDEFAGLSTVDGGKRAVTFCTILKVLEYAGTNENDTRTDCPIKVNDNANETIILQNFNYNRILSIRLVNWAADQLNAQNDTVWGQMHTDINNNFYIQALLDVGNCIQQISDLKTRLLAYLTIIRDLILINATAGSRVNSTVIDSLMADQTKPSSLQ